MSKPLPEKALAAAAEGPEPFGAGATPVVLAPSATRPEIARAAALAGLPYPAAIELTEKDRPLLLAALPDAKRARLFAAQLQDAGLPARAQRSTSGASHSASFTAAVLLFWGVILSPLLMVTGLIELVGLMTALGAAAKFIAVASAALYAALVVYLPTVAHLRGRRQALLQKPFTAHAERLAELEAADPEAAAHFGRAQALRRELLGLDMSDSARADILSGLDEVSQSVERLGRERGKVREALATDSVARLRRRRAEPQTEPPDDSLTLAISQLTALERHQEHLDAAVGRFNNGLDALSMAFARLSADDTLATEAELAGLIQRTREVCEASEEVVAARIPSSSISASGLSALGRARTLA